MTRTVGSPRRQPRERCVSTLAVFIVAFVVVAFGIGATGPAEAKRRRKAPKKKPAPAAVDPGPLREDILGGTHWRVPTDNGPLHVFSPAGYNPATASTVVYIHGYYTKVDRAVTEHKLLEQFAATKRNALFVIPEAPSGLRDGVKWWSLGELLRAAKEATGLARPWGPLVVVGHSGAYRTILAWLDYPAIDVVALVDAMYGEEGAYRAWLAEADNRRLIHIGADTLRWTEDFVRDINAEVILDQIPERPIDVPPEATTARHVYLRSQLGHMDLVMQGGALPTLLRIANVAPIAHKAGP